MAPHLAVCDVDLELTRSSEDWEKKKVCPELAPQDMCVYIYIYIYACTD